MHALRVLMFSSAWFDLPCFSAAEVVEVTPAGAIGMSLVAVHGYLKM
jgi:hypothetical protein